jgi:hypothetical protein
MSTIRTVVIEERLEPENILLQEITYNIKAVITGITRRDLFIFCAGYCRRRLLRLRLSSTLFSFNCSSTLRSSQA